MKKPELHWSVQINLKKHAERKKRNQESQPFVFYIYHLNNIWNKQNIIYYLWRYSHGVNILKSVHENEKFTVVMYGGNGVGFYLYLWVLALKLSKLYIVYILYYSTVLLSVLKNKWMIFTSTSTISDYPFPRPFPTLANTISDGSLVIWSL